MSSYTVNLETQEVIVKGTISYDDALGRIKKTGKEVSFYLHRDDVNAQMISHQVRSGIVIS